MAYYDIHIHSDMGDGEDSVADIIERAKLLGWDGIAITDEYVDLKVLEQNKAKIYTMIDERNLKIDVAFGLVIAPQSIEEMRRMIKEVRREVEVLIVKGGIYEVNRAACETSEVDILSSPSAGRTDSGLDHICAKEASDNDVAIEINFREILESYKKHRVHVLRKLRANIKLCRNYDTPVITCSGAHSIWQMRAPRDLAAVAHILGVELAESLNTVSIVPERIVKMNREKLSGVRTDGTVRVDSDAEMGSVESSGETFNETPDEKKENE